MSLLSVSLITSSCGMQSAEQQVVKDSIEQYEMTKKTGDLIQIAVHAQMVEAACLQAKDEENYKKWHKIRIEAEKKAGLSQ